MELSIQELRKLSTPDKIQITMHAVQRLQQRGILLKDIISCVHTGEIIEQYPNDYPHPSCLILGITLKKRFLHVVIGSNAENLFIITAYYPDTTRWMDDLKTRKENK